MKLVCLAHIRQFVYNYLINRATSYSMYMLSMNLVKKNQNSSNQRKKSYSSSIWTVISQEVNFLYDSKGICNTLNEAGRFWFSSNQHYHWKWLPETRVNISPLPGKTNLKATLNQNYFRMFYSIMGSYHSILVLTKEWYISNHFA